MWDKARLTAYIGAALAGLAFLATVAGAGTYDPSTGNFDLHPFNVYWIAGIIAGPLSSVLATLALWMGWGGKK